MQSDWAGDQSARRFPSNRNLPEEMKWYEDHAYPGSDAPEDKQKAYYSDLLKQTDAWIKQHPNSYYIWSDRLQALDHLDDSPTAEVETCIAKLLALAQADKGPVPLDLVTDYQLVWALYNKKLQPRLQLELAQKSLDQLALESKQPSDDRTSSKTDNEDRAFWVPYNKFSGYFWEADAYVRLQQADKAQDAHRHADAASPRRDWRSFKAKSWMPWHITKAPYWPAWIRAAFLSPAKKTTSPMMLTSSGPASAGRTKAGNSGTRAAPMPSRLKAILPGRTLPIHCLPFSWPTCKAKPGSSPI
jgi:hypothetical protein